MAWKPEVHVEGKWTRNGLVFETKEESDAWGQDLLMRWFVPDNVRSVEVDEPVNYRIVNGKMESVS